MGGYDFLMQNYREGDRICLFGFSRGAYTARALAGMIYKVSRLVEISGFSFDFLSRPCKVGLVPIGNVGELEVKHVHTGIE